MPIAFLLVLLKKKKKKRKKLSVIDSKGVKGFFVHFSGGFIDWF